MRRGQRSGPAGPWRPFARPSRVSTPKQATVPHQVELCRKRCEASGYQVRYILLSAKDTDRPKLQHSLCRSHQVDVVVVWKLDRLVRSLRVLPNTQ